MTDPLNLEQLQSQMKDATPNEKQRIFMRILEHAFEDIQDILFDSMRDNNYRIRSASAKMIGKMGDQTVVPRLLHLLTDESWIVRSSAEEALSYLPAEIAIPAFRGILSSAIGDPALHKHLAHVISRYDHPETEVLLVRMYEKAQDEELRACLVECLAKNTGETSLEKIFSALKDDSWIVRKNAIKALRSMDENTVISKCSQAISDPNRLIHMAAIEILIRIGNTKVVDAMTQTLQDGTVVGRINAINVLVGIHSEESLALVVAALNDSNIMVRNRAIESLAIVHSNDVIDLLKRCLKSKNWNLRLGAIKTLGMIASSEAVDILENLLKENHVSIRLAVLEELTRIGDRRSIRLVMQYISLPELGEDAIRIIKSLDPDQAIVHLASFLADTAFFDKTIDALRSMDSVKVQRYLASRITNGTPAEQLSAVRALSLLGGRDTARHLESVMIGSISIELRQEIEKALKYLRKKLK
ncbi:HEAT repeat domain-containing protein [bacterium]|nr:HEAT repeat domain-containing protein [candidate division CSSED10-310 bacterium]